MRKTKNTNHKSIKFHSSENINKTHDLVQFLEECQKIKNILLYHNQGIIENNEYDFVANTRLFNDIFKIRSHHFHQIQLEVFTLITNRYESILKNDFHSPYLNYFKHFFNKWNIVENYLTKKKYDDLLNYWKSNKENIIRTINDFVLDKINKKPIKINRLYLRIDHRSTEFNDSETTHFKKWFEIHTNELISKGRYKQIDIPIKYSNYHDKKLDNKILSKSFIMKYDEIYNRLEFVGSYEIDDIPLNNKNINKNNTLGIDTGYNNHLFTISNGILIDGNQSMKKEIDRFKKYESNV